MTTQTMHRAATAQPQAVRRGAVASRYARQGRRRAWRADLLYAGGWASVASAIALYLADGGLRSISTVADLFVAIGICTGLAATDATLLMLLLAARVPAIDKVIGQVKATQIHAKLGQWVVIGLVMHAAFLLTGYALSEGVSLVAMFGELWGSTMDFGWAVLALGLFLLVSVTSIATARRKLPYEAWHAIHLTTYVAVIASIPHQFSMGGLLEAGPQRWYWMAILALTGIALLTYRLLLPLLSSLDHRLRVSQVTPIAPDTVSIELSGRKLDELETAAGQYFHWRFLAPGLWWQQHPFSVSAQPGKNSLRITVRALGKGTAALQRVRPGTRVAIEGPYGIFSDAARTADSVVLIGAGVGIAPIRAVLEETTVVPGRATVILRASSPDQLYLVDEIAHLCRDRGAALVTLTGHRAHDSWVPQRYAGTTLRDWVPFVAEADVFVCGPDGFTAAVVADARAAGTPAKQIHDERFNW